MSFTPSAANIDMPDGVVQQLTLRSHVSQSSGMLQPQQLDDEANSTFLTSMPASSVSRTVQKPALAPSSGVSPDRPAVSDELVYANASAKTSHALLARYMSNASSCGTELNEVKEAAVGAVRTVLASKAGTLSGEPVVVKDIADELTKQTNSMFQSLASRSEEARGDSEEVPIAASLEVALRVRKLRSREANRDASQRDKHAASNRDDGSGVSNTDVRKRLAAIERAASVSKPRVQILKWAPVPDRATEFAKEVGFSRVDLLHLDHVRKQRKQRQQIEEERKAFTEAAKQEVSPWVV